MRWLSLLLISVLMLGQIHLCQESYQLPNGQTCLTCPELVDPVQEVSTNSDGLAAAHGDCHDCCEVRPCSDQEKPSLESVQAGSTFEFVACLPLHFEFTVPTVSVKDAIAIHVDSAPTTGPPGTKSSRAPPEFTVQSPSAGRRIVIA